MNRNIRIAAAYVAFFAMLLHGLIPVGWMPGGGGGSPITICTMDGLVQIDPGHHGPAQKQSPDNRHGHELCPFGASPHFAAPITVAAVAVPTQSGAFGPAAVRRKSHASRTPYSPQSPRAPPALV